jgi:hypothetical protein
MYPMLVGEGPRRGMTESEERARQKELADRLKASGALDGATE